MIGRLYSGDYTSRLLKRRMRSVVSPVTEHRAVSPKQNTLHLSDSEVQMIERMRRARAMRQAINAANSHLEKLTQLDQRDVLIDLIVEYERRTGDLSFSKNEF